MFVRSCVPSVASEQSSSLMSSKISCLSDGAKVRRFFHSANNMLVLFRIPHLWYFARKHPLTLFIYSKNV